MSDPMSPQSTVTDVKSLLTIKVLRLIKPTLVGPLTLTADPHDLVGDLWEREIQADVTAVPGIQNLSLGNFLRLPQGFGNMYLGETFASYVVIQNESLIPVSNASCKIELQTQTQKFVLADKRTVPELKPGETIDIVMHHEVKEMGKHMLIVTLSYSVPNVQLPNSEPIVLERYFKFQVKKPLDVKTKLYNAESDEVFLEAQVQNITSSPIYLEKVNMEPSQFFNCVAMNNDEIQLVSRDRNKDMSLMINSKTPTSTWPCKMLEVDDAIQFLYRLSRNSEPTVRGVAVATNIGKLDIVWRTYLGDKGRLQTSQLVRQPPFINDLKVTVDQIPDICALDTPFEAQLQVINTTIDRDMELDLDLDPNLPEGYCWLGLTKCKIGTLSSSSTKSTRITLSIFPIRTGLINLSGIKLVDTKKGETFLFNDIAQVLIIQQQ